MKQSKIVKAKDALDKIINKSRVHLYKPIQIAEILYHDRVFHDVKLADIETYRNKSKKWRDDISSLLLGRVCTSSARFQDDVFNENAMPPHLLVELGKANRKTKGAVEAYIYSKFSNKHNQLANALELCKNSTKETFNVEKLINAFWSESGLKRSIDKVYEIIVYALFSTLVEALQLKVEISISADVKDILQDFSDFAKMVMCLDVNNTTATNDAKIYRVGVTNAADRGLDMYSNWGPAIQIKHLTLDVELAHSIVEGISSDRIVIICKKAEQNVIVSLLTQIGWRSRIQSVITEQNLIDWYNKALCGKYANILGDKLLSILSQEIEREFPSVAILPEELQQRNYSAIRNKGIWM